MFSWEKGLPRGLFSFWAFGKEKGGIRCLRLVSAMILKLQGTEKSLGGLGKPWIPWLHP